MNEYDIYPCDLTMTGECPKHCQDCANCAGWFLSDFEEMPDLLDDILSEVP